MYTTCLDGQTVRVCHICTAKCTAWREQLWKTLYTYIRTVFINHLPEYHRCATLLEFAISCALHIIHIQYAHIWGCINFITYAVCTVQYTLLFVQNIYMYAKMYMLLNQHTRWIWNQTELYSYLSATWSDSLDDETDIIFGYMKWKCCESSSFISPIHMFTNTWGQSQSHLGTPPLERIIARAICHHCHETILHSLHAHFLLLDWCWVRTEPTRHWVAYLNWLLPLNPQYSELLSHGLVTGSTGSHSSS